MPETATDGANNPIRFCSKTVCEQEISVLRSVSQYPVMNKKRALRLFKVNPASPEMSHVMRKLVYAICEQQKRRSAPLLFAD